VIPPQATSSGRPLMRQTSSSTRRPPSSRQQATSTAVIYLLAVHELVDDKVHGKARYLAQAEAMAIIAALNRFAPAALHGADSVGSRGVRPAPAPGFEVRQSAPAANRDVLEQREISQCRSRRTRRVGRLRCVAAGTPSRRRRRTRRERAVGSARSRARRPRGRGRARWNRVYSRTAFTATFRRRHPPRGRSGQRSTPARGGRSSTRRRLQRRRGRLRCCCSRR
jgi:hypothetical protein